MLGYSVHNPESGTLITALEISNIICPTLSIYQTIRQRQENMQTKLTSIQIQIQVYKSKSIYKTKYKRTCIGYTA